MAEKMPQDFSQHSRLDPPFHFLMAPAFGITCVIVHLVRRPGLHSAWFVVFMVAATAAVFKMRLYALKVQERITRLEELEDEPLRGRMGELSV